MTRSIPLDLLWLIPPTAYAIRATGLWLDTRRTLAATRFPPSEPHVVAYMRGNRLRDGLRAVVGVLLVAFMCMAPLLADLIPTTARIDGRNWIVVTVILLLLAVSESEVAGRRRLVRHHRDDAEREARRLFRGRK